MKFRKLNTEETLEFRLSARESYKPFDPIQGIWHPVYQLECVRMNGESAQFVEDEKWKMNGLKELRCLSIPVRTVHYVDQQKAILATCHAQPVVNLIG